MMRLMICIAAMAIPHSALAFCGGWNSPVAPGFDGASWGDKWYVLATILTAVALFSIFVIRRVIVMRDLPPEEV